MLTDLPKPPVVLPRGAVVATAGGCLVQGTARLEILASLDISNPLGEIVLARVREPGTAEISGPERTRDVQAAIDALLDWSDLVLIDGALDRIAASAPAVTEAAILATGGGAQLRPGARGGKHRLLGPEIAAAGICPPYPARRRTFCRRQIRSAKPRRHRQAPAHGHLNRWAGGAFWDYLDAQWSCLLVAER